MGNTKSKLSAIAVSYPANNLIETVRVLAETKLASNFKKRTSYL